MTLSTDDIKAIAYHYASTGTAPVWDSEVLFAFKYHGYVMPKERPRTGRSGHTYTPKKTQDCEKLILSAALTKGVRNVIYCPVEMWVSITISRSNELERLFLSPTVGDLDNRVKTVTDALNGYIYKDDKQIKRLVAEQKYAEKDSVTVSIHRAGLSKGEFALLRKYI